MAFSAVADARRVMKGKRKFDNEADCSNCERRRLCLSLKSGSYLCADCVSDLEANRIIHIEAARYKKLTDEAIVGIRSHDESTIILSLDARADVVARMADSDDGGSVEFFMEMLFADRAIDNEFNIEHSALKFSAGLWRHMEHHRNLTAGFVAEIGKNRCDAETLSAPLTRRCAMVAMVPPRRLPHHGRDGRRLVAD
jgi:hypothetical protein